MYLPLILKFPPSPNVVTSRQRKRSGYWKIRDAEGMDGLRSRKPGRKPIPEANREVERLPLENLRLQERLRKAEFIIEVQKKVAELLGDGLVSPTNGPL